jgi:hypothetical protein
VCFTVAYSSYLPSLIGRDQLIDGNGKLRTSQSFAELAGPSLGALLVGLLGAALAMSGDAVSYAVSAICLGAIRTGAIRTGEPQAARGRPDRRASFRADLGTGIRYVLRDPILRQMVAWNGTANFFVIIVETLGPLFLVRELHLRPAYVGLLLALGAAGGVAAGLGSARLARRIGSARIAWLATTAFTAPGLLIPLARPGWWVLLFAAGWMSWTFGATLCGVAVAGYQQGTCPAGLLGRVTGAARWATWGTLPLGGLAAGGLGALLGVHAALWIAVTGGCLSGLWLYFSPLRRLRDMPAERLRPSALGPVTAG